jgi:hypothetical protein
MHPITQCASGYQPRYQSESALQSHILDESFTKPQGWLLVALSTLAEMVRKRDVKRLVFGKLASWAGGMYISCNPEPAKAEGAYSASGRLHLCYSTTAPWFVSFFHWGCSCS